MSQRPNSRTSQRIHKYPRIHKYCTFEYSSLCLALCLFNIFHSLVDIYNNRELYLAWNVHTPTGGDRLAYNRAKTAYKKLFRQFVGHQDRFRTRGAFILHFLFPWCFVRIPTLLCALSTLVFAVSTMDACFMRTLVWLRYLFAFLCSTLNNFFFPYNCFSQYPSHANYTDLQTQMLGKSEFSHRDRDCLRNTDPSHYKWSA